MRDWLSAPELAALGLPGLPATKQGWLDYAEREGWLLRTDKVRLRRGRGGGLEYSIDLLPAAALAAYAARAIGEVALPAEDAAAAAVEEQKKQLTLIALDNRDARLTLLAAADRYAKGAQLSRVMADRTFAALYNLGQIEVEPGVRAAVPKLSRRTLARWRETKRRGISGLGVDKGAARRGKGALDRGGEGKVRAFLTAAIAKQPHLSSDHLLKAVEKRFPDVKVSIRTVQRMRAKITSEDKVLLIKITNPDAYKSKYRLSGTNSHAVERLNELWMIDASPADALCVDGRHAVYLCVDIFSRRLIVYVSRTPRADAVALLMRRAIIAWGVPERVKTDNGSDFTAKATQRLFKALEIEVELSDPFSPEQKGHIERAVGTFQRDLCPLLPGFIGHSVKDRKVIEERRAFSARLGQDDAGAFCVELNARELQSYCDDWAAGRYAHRPHSGIEGATPFQMAASFAGTVRRIEGDDVRALDLLLAPAAGGDGIRTVTKRGVRVDGSYYLTPDVDPETRVLVRMDPEDMGHAWLFSADGAAFLGEAICPELAGVDPAAAVAHARAAREQHMKEQAAAVRADMKQFHPRYFADVVVRDAAIAAGKLVEFPKPSEPHSTPALQAAKAAIEAPAPAPQSEQQRATLAEIESDLAGAAPITPARVAQLPETKQQRFRRALQIEERIARNERVSTEDAMWLGAYQAGPEYRAMRELYQDFGEAALR
ncbi:DDE-type integrase/transposase/recombinase [Methylosinus sp. Sm6]|uniref:DDE-type integrase/transposase/recombinase n=1 Tax=Methylosinus sp. Sm6 TaxID=2866948 RepID=UPI001C99F3E0|nr:DDE-type integrase/transposase/recombinase [Methylosinus sp. Sm6]MBY6243921.1 DDE-type integrase/transposase/recombinase [Methylosinus sp. Sm6]